MYLLIMTMIFKSGSGGMGGVETVLFTTLDDCNRVGEAWLRQIKIKRRVHENEAFFTCVIKHKK